MGSEMCIRDRDLDGNPINGTTLPFNGGPPRHWGCRSVLTSITKTFKEMGIKGLPELPDTGERASDLGPIDRNTTTVSYTHLTLPTIYSV